MYAFIVQPPRAGGLARVYVGNSGAAAWGVRAEPRGANGRLRLGGALRISVSQPPLLPLPHRRSHTRYGRSPGKRPPVARGDPFCLRPLQRGWGSACRRPIDHLFDRRQIAPESCTRAPKPAIQRRNPHLQSKSGSKKSPVPHSGPSAILTSSRVRHPWAEITGTATKPCHNVSSLSHVNHAKLCR